MAKYLLIIMAYTLMSPVHAMRNGIELKQSSTNFPNLVRISLGQSTCSGIRVSRTKIITAAHCFKYGDKKFKVKFQNGKCNFEGTYPVSSKVKILDTRQDREIAIIEINPSRSSKCLGEELFKAPRIYPYLEGEFNQNQTFEILGFGMNKNGKIGALQYGHVSFKDDFRSLIPLIQQSDENTQPYPMIVVKPILPSDGIIEHNSRTSYNQLPCPGDSGGPLFINLNGERMLVGIISMIEVDRDENTKKTPLHSCRNGVKGFYIPLFSHMKLLTDNGVID